MGKVIFVGGLFPLENKADIIKNSKGPIQFAADVLQWNIVKGLDYFYPDLKIVNSLYIGSFPILYKKVLISNDTFSHNKISNDVNVGFVNLPIIKNFSRYYHIKNELLRHITEDNDSIILVYSMHTAFMKAVVEVKKKFPSTKLCLIIPDLPDYMNDNPGFIKKMMKNVDKKQQNLLLPHFDLYVLLSKFMIEKLPVQPNKCVVMEGIYGSEINNESELVQKEDFTILYTGTLAKRYGIIDLLEAFKALKYKDMKLWICGDGDGRKDVEKLVHNDNRVSYFGQLPHDDILQLQRRASLLVNPRKNEGVFTKYSFPSKTMEYFASATPTLIYRLKGIPDEYFEYCFTVDEDKHEKLETKIEYIYNLNLVDRINLGKKAQNFIINEKNPRTQVQKIIEKLKEITN